MNNSQTALTGGKDDNSVSWDDLHDAIDVGCRQSMVYLIPLNDTKPKTPSDTNFSRYSAQAQSSSRKEASEDFVPAQINTRNRGRNIPVKSDNPSNLNNSTVSWDDLGEEIERALRISQKEFRDSRVINCKDFMVDSSWNCPACTFLNENPLHLVCGVCGTAKEADKPTLPPSARLGHASPLHGSFTSHSSRNMLKTHDDGKHWSGSFTSQSSLKVENLENSCQKLEPFEIFDYSGKHLQNLRKDDDLSNSCLGGSRSGKSRRKSREFSNNASKTGDEGVQLTPTSLKQSPSSSTFHRDGFESGHFFSSDKQINVKVDQDDGHSVGSELTDEDHDDSVSRSMASIKTLRVPEGEITIVYTDIQGSTTLWEADPDSMKTSIDLHDTIIRKCYADHSGYEITTEGDSFHLAFQHPSDALAFALKAQLQLYKAKWPEAILKHPAAAYNREKAFRGFRVRIGIHYGPTKSSVHETTGRITYQGEAVDIAKALEKMAHGGQILTTVETWRVVSGMSEQFLGKPQVMDCGEHLLFDPKRKKRSSKLGRSTRIVQLVPHQLAYDFFAVRGGKEEVQSKLSSHVSGRVFPPLSSYGQLSTSFLNAPYIGNKVAIVFVYTDRMDSLDSIMRKKNRKYMAKCVRSHLMRLTPPGYECHEDKGNWMLAFDCIENGVKFGTCLSESLSKSSHLQGGVDQNKVFKIGMCWGHFSSMGPHTVTGHADYFGPIVNRAARVAEQSKLGQICIGVPSDDVDKKLPEYGPNVEVEVLGLKFLRGISREFMIYSCKRKNV